MFGLLINRLDTPTVRRFVDFKKKIGFPAFSQVCFYAHLRLGLYVCAILGPNPEDRVGARQVVGESQMDLMCCLLEL